MFEQVYMTGLKFSFAFTATGKLEPMADAHLFFPKKVGFGTERIRILLDIGLYLKLQSTVLRQGSHHELSRDFKFQA
jgi:hypothetical protein